MNREQDNLDRDLSKLLRMGVIVMIGSSLAACVSQSTFDDLQKKYDVVATQRDALEIQNDTLKRTLTDEEREKLKKAEESEQLKHSLDEASQKLSMTSEQLQELKSKAEEQKMLYGNLVKELSGELETKQVTIEQLKSGINVNLTEEILFPSGSAKLHDSGKDVLLKVSKQLEKVPYQIIVSGFTDNVPIRGMLATRYPSNWDLAAARATNVVRLLEESNISSDKLVAASFGENQPVADNATPEGRKKNRRIEIRLRPVAAQ